MLKRWFIAIIASLVFLVGSVAQDRQNVALDLLYSALSQSCVVLECSYSMTLPETRVSGEAELKMQGNAYTMQGNGLSVYCDGETVWTLDMAAREAYIEASVVSFNLAELFEVSGVSTAGSGYSYSLEPVAECGIDSVDMVLTPGGNIRTMSFYLSDGNRLDLKASSMKIEDKKTVTSFRPEISFGQDWVVTDMR